MHGRASYFVPTGAALGPDLGARWLGQFGGASPELMVVGIWPEQGLIDREGEWVGRESKMRREKKNCLGFVRV